MKRKIVILNQPFVLVLCLSFAALAAGFGFGCLISGLGGNASEKMPGMVDYVGGQTKSIKIAKKENTLKSVSQSNISPHETVIADEENVTMMTQNEQKYIVGVYNGFIAVFFDMENEGEELVLKEITDRHTSALTKLDAEKLQHGIKVKGNEALFQLLQDYGS